MRLPLAMLVISGLAWATTALQAADAPPAQTDLEMAMGAVDISPAIDPNRPAYLAGYGQNRPAESIHDPIFVRGMVLKIAGKKLAVLSVDVVGMQYPDVQKIRAGLPEFDYVLVSSTHNHEAPDTIGLWGPTPFKSGVGRGWVESVVEKAVTLTKELAGRTTQVAARYGTAEDATLLSDSRLPKVYDGILRTVTFYSPEDQKPAGIAVVWSCHPESMGSRNVRLTADFPWATVASLEKKYGCPIVYLTGSVGGLMAPPDNRVADANGNYPGEGDFEYARLYGEAVANLAAQAVDSGTPIQLGPFEFSARKVYVPLANPLYRAARLIGVLPRDGYAQLEDPYAKGSVIAKEDTTSAVAIESEVAYLQLGELHIACIPGELYPELVYGQFQEPVEPNVDFPDAPLEPTVANLMPGEKFWCLGLANDEVGYIIPRRQWDDVAPFAYGRDSKQYGEINSCGPDVAPVLMNALKQCVADVQAK